MTRSEFTGGWTVLKKAALPTSAEQPDEDVCFGALQDIDAKLWGLTVRKAVRECAFFPTPFSLREIATGILSEQIKAKHVHPSDRQLTSGRNAVEFRSGHPDCPKNPSEGFLEYLERLSIFLGYKTGVATDDPRATDDLAARMRADAERAGESWADR